MTEKEFNFWQDHSLRFLEMALNWDRREIVENPDALGQTTGQCGDTVTMYLTLQGNRITWVSFDTDGCMNTNACGNTVARLVEGKTVDEAWDITPQDVIAYLETLAPENHHCAELAVGALYLALADFHSQNNSGGASHGGI